MLDTSFAHNVTPFGIGSYTATEAARLLKVDPRRINRWLRGSGFVGGDTPRSVGPLWTPQIPDTGKVLEIGFRDLIELRFIVAFNAAGLSIRTVRRCLEEARSFIDADYPFSTRKFRTDGRTIFLERLLEGREPELLDLGRKQYVFRDVVDRTFKDLDFEDELVVRWRPYRSKASIVIDPSRAFGQPIAAASGVPTVTLDEAVTAEGSMDRVARLYEVPVSVVRDAVAFEAELRAA